MLRDAPIDIQGVFRKFKKKKITLEAGKKKKIHPRSGQEKKKFTLQVAKNQHWGCIEEEKIHPQRRREEKKSPPNPLRRKKIHPQTKLPNPPWISNGASLSPQL